MQNASQTQEGALFRDIFNNPKGVTQELIMKHMKATLGGMIVFENLWTPYRDCTASEYIKKPAIDGSDSQVEMAKRLEGYTGVIQSQLDIAYLYPEDFTSVPYDLPGQKLPPIEFNRYRYFQTSRLETRLSIAAPQDWNKFFYMPLLRELGDHMNLYSRSESGRLHIKKEWHNIPILQKMDVSGMGSPVFGKPFLHLRDCSGPINGKVFSNETGTKKRILITMSGHIDMATSFQYFEEYIRRFFDSYYLNYDAGTRDNVKVNYHPLKFIVQRQDYSDMKFRSKGDGIYLLFTRDVPCLVDGTMYQMSAEEFAENCTNSACDYTFNINLLLRTSIYKDPNGEDKIMIEPFAQFELRHASVRRYLTEVMCRDDEMKIVNQILKPRDKVILKK